MNNLILVTYILLGLAFCVTPPNNQISSFEIDETIKETAEAKFSNLEIGSSSEDLFLIYENPLIADYYEEGHLAMSSQQESNRIPFRSFYYYQNDTLVIDGMYGLFGGFGFSIKIKGNQAEIYHLVTGDDFPEHSLTIDGELQFRVEVPCTKAELILSEFPTPIGQEIIYGLVEFESIDFFHRGTTVEGEEIEARSKVRMDMKVYFKSKFLDIERMG